MLEWTGERLIPEAVEGELVLAEHLARYRLAAHLAPGRRVLDAACGEGYGSVLLREAGAEEVVGVDLDPATVAHARDTHGVASVEGDVADLPFDDGTFDLVVSFETIEHVKDPDRALDEFARVLTDAGMLIISTPNALEYLDDNPYHLREFTSGEFLSALRSRFPEVTPLYQQNFLTSAILDAERMKYDNGQRVVGLEATKVAGVEPGRELYSIVLCGRAPLPVLDGNIAVLAGIFEAHHLAREFRESKSRALEAKRIQQEWYARATEAERIQQEWEARATEAERQLAELRLTLDRVMSSVSWRLTKPLRAVKGKLAR
jgi:2-polyprenyl-3-methyl-5-hydroxy-6-metoxy-1,4-benzoquinol methylase